MTAPGYDFAMTHWYTGKQCPECDGALYTNKYMVWCEQCFYKKLACETAQEPPPVVRCGNCNTDLEWEEDPPYYGEGIA